MLKKSFSQLNGYSKRLLSLQKLDGFDWTKLDEVIMKPFQYVERVPNKHHRMMAPAFNHWLQIPGEKLHGIEEAMKAFISWLILFDDIQDDSAHRYGAPAAQKVFGVPLTINALSKGLLLGQKHLIELGNPLVLDIFMKRLEEFLDGQGIDIYWREQLSCPSEEVHTKMMKLKCASGFALPVELMQVFSRNKEEDYVELASNIGMFYQLVDDYCNLFKPKFLAGFTSKEQNNYVSVSDITESKFSMPIIHALQFPDVADELADILRQRTSDPKLVRRAISLLKKHNSDEYMKNRVRTIEAEIRTKIEQLGGNSKLIALIDVLTFQKQEP